MGSVLIKAFILSLFEWLIFPGRLVVAIPQAGWKNVPRRLLIFGSAWLVMGILNAIHWLGFALDEIFFRNYRHIQIIQPLFILGVPRSGTTFLQRVLAQDSNLTSLTLWECLLAPSISERYCWRSIGRLFSPFIKPLIRWGSKNTDAFNAIHPLGLKEPEEDFLLLLPVQACFLMVLLCPKDRHFWQLSNFDDGIGTKRRQCIMAFYKRCLQKHLYYHGVRKQILSKNPSFTPFIASLRATFSDAQFVACIRAPQSAIPSQLSALLPAVKFLGFKKLPDEFSQSILDMLQRYYEIIKQQQSANDLQTVDLSELSANLYACVNRLYAVFNRNLSKDFYHKLQAMELNGRKYRSRHQHTLSDNSLIDHQVRQRFAPYWPMVTLLNQTAEVSFNETHI